MSAVRRLLVSSLILMLVGAGLIAVVTLRATGQDRDIDLVGIESGEFDQMGFRLLEPPSGYAPKVTSQAATTTALAQEPGSSAREAVLAELVRDGVDDKSMVWAVNLEPTSVHAEEPLGDIDNQLCPSSGNPEFALVFVNAESGEFVFDVQKAQLPEPRENGECPPPPSEPALPSATKMPGAESP